MSIPRPPIVSPERRNDSKPSPDDCSMFGSSILVAPVLHRTTAQFYIPSGTWTDFWTGATITGPKWITDAHYPLDLIPVYVRPGTVLLLGPEGVDVPDYEYAEVELEVRTYEVDEEVRVGVPGMDGKMAGWVKVGKEGVVDDGGMKVRMRSE